MEQNGDQIADSNLEATYIPYQPALDAGIPEEWDRNNARRIDLLKRTSIGELTPEEEVELGELQCSVIAYFHDKLRAHSIDERIAALERRFDVAQES